MGTNDIDILILKYLSGAARPDEISSLLQWMNESPENRRLLMRKKSLWDASHLPFSYESIDVGKAQSEMMEKIAADSLARPARTWLAHKRAMAAAVLAGICLGAGVFFAVERFAQGKPAEKHYTYQTIRSSNSSLTQTILPDGSKVCLNANSEITYSSDFVNERSLSLSGEAYFEVKSSQDYPFTVTTRDLTVRATGTAFNINAYPKTEESSVILVKGKVSVNVPSRQSFTLKAGERLVLDTNNDAITVSNTQTYLWYAWKDGLLIFDDMPLKDVFLRLEQIFNVQFILSDPAVGNTVFHATFQSENLNEIIGIIEESGLVKCTYLNNNQSTDSLSVACIRVTRARS